MNRKELYKEIKTYNRDEAIGICNELLNITAQRFLENLATRDDIARGFMVMELYKEFGEIDKTLEKDIDYYAWSLYRDLKELETEGWSVNENE